MQRDDLVYVGHMLDCAASAVNKLEHFSRAEYDADETLRLAIAHLLQTIGEAARRVSQPFREGHPQIPWNQIVGLRHKVVHDYLHVDYDIVWDVATMELPKLINELQKME